MKKSHSLAHDRKVSLVSSRMRLFSREEQSAGHNQLHAYNVLLLRASAARGCFVLSLAGDAKVRVANPRLSRCPPCHRARGPRSVARD